MQIIRKHDDEEDVEIIINGVSVLSKIISLKMYEYSGIDILAKNKKVPYLHTVRYIKFRRLF